ncbi:molybdate transport system ATP-binding protein [Dyadobacter jejuensis]|uniref:Molybdate transport system ATP-binding protein n=1 Tax=Dyadobacter jejuensis TaxID=1082580 RepID=A0A316AS88_9BACT|nr:ATP-binding cassette domain-containing protein [Dyadobacter jejuensis]PWJ60563.1 molybdate transport system ATP-binding protein [Dyadobacter jejuensis]
MKALHFKDVSVRKYDSIILQNIQWTLHPQEQWAIIGPNGSGKSTLLECLAGKWPLWKGQIDTGQNGPLREQVELLPSDYSFNRIVNAGAEYYQQRFHAYEAERAPTVRAILTDQLRPIGTIDDKSVDLAPSSISEENLLKITHLLSITHLLDHPFVTLSNGETRRMLLAKSLVKRPKFLLLDSPFAGLDTHSRQVLHHALKVLTDEGTRIVLVTTSTEIPECITHVLELDEGRIARQQPISLFRSHPQHRPQLPLPSAEHLARFGLPHTNNFEYAVDLRNIRVTYGSEQILKGIDWKVAKGEKWALSGPNGSGKSTLLSIITADNPQRFANDFDLFDQKRGGIGASIWDIKQKIGHISPELHLYFPRHTPVHKTIASGFFDATGVFFKKLSPEQLEKVQEVAEILHVADLLEKDFAQLSKGQQRLVLLARALVKNPPLLILDEPCQGLDVQATEYFKDIVDAICHNDERTLIYVSHYPHEIPSCVTHFIKIKDGLIAEQTRIKQTENQD